jgi:hypothetical protein
VVRHVFDKLLKEAKGQTWVEDVAKLSGKYIKDISLFGIFINFTPPKQDLVEKIKHQKAGLLPPCFEGRSDGFSKAMVFSGTRNVN